MRYFVSAGGVSAWEKEKLPNSGKIVQGEAEASGLWCVCIPFEPGNIGQSFFDFDQDVWKIQKYLWDSDQS